MLLDLNTYIYKDSPWGLHETMGQSTPYLNKSQSNKATYNTIIKAVSLAAEGRHVGHVLYCNISLTM